MNNKLLPAALLLATALSTQSTWANFDPLNLTVTAPNITSSFVTVEYVIPAAPGIASNFITVEYDAGLESLTAEGFANLLTPPGAPSGDIAGGSFDIAAIVDNSGTASGGTLNIGGTLLGLGFSSGTLLTATLSAFNAGPGELLDFVFDVTGGDAAALMGSQVEVTLSQTGYDGNFGSDFTSGAFAALSDTVSTLEPDAVLTAEGFANLLTPPGAPGGDIAGGSFDIAATIDDTLMTATGTLSIGGTIAGLGFNSGTLLTATLSSLGGGTDDPLEFVFNVTGGDAAALMGSTVGVNLENSGYAGTFASGFTSGAFAGRSDTFSYRAPNQDPNQNPLPAPGTLIILAAGLAGLAIARRKSLPQH